MLKLLKSFLGLLSDFTLSNNLNLLRLKLLWLSVVSDLFFSSVFSLLRLGTLDFRFPIFSCVTEILLLSMFNLLFSKLSPLFFLTMETFDNLFFREVNLGFSFFPDLLTLVVTLAIIFFTRPPPSVCFVSSLFSFNLKLSLPRTELKSFQL